jgi:hypothetical protein
MKWKVPMTYLRTFAPLANCFHGVHNPRAQFLATHCWVIEHSRLHQGAEMLQLPLALNVLQPESIVLSLKLQETISLFKEMDVS